MVGRAWIAGRERTRQLMFTIWRSAKSQKGQQLLLQRTIITFCSSQGSDYPRFSTNIEDDGCFEPWNLQLCLSKETTNRRKVYVEMCSFIVNLLFDAMQSSESHKQKPAVHDASLCAHLVYLIARCPPSTTKQVSFQYKSKQASAPVNRLELMAIPPRMSNARPPPAKKPPGPKRGGPADARRVSISRIHLRRVSSFMVDEVKKPGPPGPFSSYHSQSQKRCIQRYMHYL
jgi:hypothetical protein